MHCFQVSSRGDDGNDGDAAAAVDDGRSCAEDEAEAMAAKESARLNLAAKQRDRFIPDSY